MVASVRSELCKRLPAQPITHMRDHLWAIDMEIFRSGTALCKPEPRFCRSYLIVLYAENLLETTHQLTRISRYLQEHELCSVHHHSNLSAASLHPRRPRCQYAAGFCTSGKQRDRSTKILAAERKCIVLVLSKSLLERRLATLIPAVKAFCFPCGGRHSSCGSRQPYLSLLRLLHNLWLVIMLPLCRPTVVRAVSAGMLTLAPCHALHTANVRG